MKKAIIAAAFLFFVGPVFFVVMILSVFVSEEEKESIVDLGGLSVSEAVMRHKPTVEKYCREYGISEYVGYILAIMQVESGGSGNDVMQASESLGLPVNTLGLDASIKQGCYYFAYNLRYAEKLGCDVNSVIQAYNYGTGFIDFVAKNGKVYSFELAERFSIEMSGGQKVDYFNPIAIAKNGGYRYDYGNMFYVELVSQYLGSSGVFVWPSKDCFVVTSVFGNRKHPISGANENHSGVDIARYGDAFGTDVVTIADGTVLVSEWHGGYGNMVIIDHGGGYRSLYGHNSRLTVQIDDVVRQGQTIAICGSTGDSTGAHIHLEVWKDGQRIDPLSLYPENVYTYG